MNKIVLLLAPRLDLSFKNGNFRLFYKRVEPIRRHWENMIRIINNHHIESGDIVLKQDLPLWMFKESDVNKINPDIVYIPHKTFEQFIVNKNIECRYYMQMTIPWLFQIDKKGWGPSASIYPISNNYNLYEFKRAKEIFRKLQRRQLYGSSKFKQPERNWTETDYVLFTCQIPHDDSIKLHGNNFSVKEALSITVNYCNSKNKKLVIRGHPQNKSSMLELKKMFPEDLFHWADDVNINDLIKNCRILVTINSGTGFEAILHMKPVMVFGKCEYDTVVNKYSENNFFSNMDKPMMNKNDYIHFIGKYHSLMYNSKDSSTLTNYK